MGFFDRCDHHWLDVKRKVVKGVLERGGSVEYGGGLLAPTHLSPEAEDITYGYTLIEQRCERCNEVRVRKFTGAMDE